MRIATFNILHGRSPDDGRVDVDRLAAAVKSLDADVLGLQEVDRDQPRSLGADLTAVAAEAMGAPEHQFVAALHGTPGGTWMAATGEEQPGSATYGIALLSRYPVVSWRVVRLPPLRASVPLWSTLEQPAVPGARRAAGGGRGGARRAVRRVHRLQHAPVVHPGMERAAAAPAGALAHRHAGAARRHRGPQHAAAQAARLSGMRSIAAANTFPVGRPRRQIDHVLVRGALRATGRGGGGAAAAVGPPRARRPLRTGLIARRLAADRRGYAHDARYGQ